MQKLIQCLFIFILIIQSKYTFSQGKLIINELLAINNGNIQDEDDTFSDWTEIYNGTDEAVQLEGWFLSDDQNDLSKWPFPNMTIESDEFQIVFASGKERKQAADKLHTNFKLSGSGEFLALSKPEENLVNTIFSAEYPEQYDNISYANFNGKYY